ncbi:MAG: hypothetical protein HQK65_01570 [Desulfamplus sp.]|nr:hypothetical protein [Desulfamplus sp.]
MFPILFYRIGISIKKAIAAELLMSKTNFDELKSNPDIFLPYYYKSYKSRRDTMFKIFGVLVVIGVGIHFFKKSDVYLKQYYKLKETGLMVKNSFVDGFENASM